MSLRSLPVVTLLVIATALTAACGDDDRSPAAAPGVTGSPTAGVDAVPPEGGAPATATAVPTPVPPGAASPAPVVPSTRGTTEHRPASPPPVVLPPRPTSAPSARDVVAAFRAAGLKVPNARDRSVDCGPDGMGLGCSELIATDTVTVYVFPDEVAAADIAEQWAGGAYRRGEVVLNYLEAPTPAAMRPAYAKVLDRLR
ncbi:hypothetical protein [Micromonospora nigra]|uniref:hypothetical protein n=1 Tax=Micromonospora nigra TaxID=145857 RepID=UPI001112EA59|nr:hypothetical protein [Micromonospora nigra]